MPFYTFRMDQFKIDDTRALHNDTDTVAVTLNVGAKSFTLTKQMGDVNNGVHEVDLEFPGIQIDDPATSIALTLAILNAGHDSTAVEDALKKGLDKLGMAAGSYLGLSVPEAAAAMILVDVGLAALFANCDGTVAADNMTVLRSDYDAVIPTGGRVLTHTKSYPGTDSSTGCGSNSLYHVTMTVVRQTPIKTSPLTGATAIAKEGFIILSRSSGLVLEVAGASNAAGAKIQQAPDNGGMNQHWELIKIDGGFVTLRSISSGQLLEVANSSLDDQAPIQQSTNIGGQNQHWELVPVDTTLPDLPFPVLPNATKFVTIRNQLSKKVLDVPGKTADANVAIQQYAETGNHNQEWQLISVGIISDQPSATDGGPDGPPVVIESGTTRRGSPTLSP